MLKRTMVFLERFFRRYWMLLCGGPVLLVLVYQAVKSGLGWNFVSHLGRPEIVHWDAVLALGIALASALSLVWWHDRWGRWLPLLVAVILVTACMGVWIQKDRNLQWEGNDVSINNYRAALLAVDTGPGDLIATWNARSNPYVEPNYIPHPREVIEKIERFRLGWIVGTRWERRDLPQDNNRMHMYPPGYPLALAGWLSLFGRSRTATQAFELFIKCCLIIVSTIWAWQYVPPEATLNRVAASLLLTTAPPVMLFVIPHANELAALLALTAFALGCKVRGARRFLAYGAAGGLLAAAAYTSFFYVLVLLAAFSMLALSKTAWRGSLPVASAAGTGLVFTGFVARGYYPWLTYLTGSQVVHYYRLSHPVDALSAALDFAYFGFPLLLVTGLGLLGVTRLGDKLAQSWMVAAAIALAAGTYQALALVATSRYLIGLFFLLVPLLASTVHNLNLTKSQVLLIPLSNFAFVLLILFL